MLKNGTPLGRAWSIITFDFFDFAQNGSIRGVSQWSLTLKGAWAFW